MSIHAGEKLELTCNVTADPAAQILWTKDGTRLPSSAALTNNNSTLTIGGVTFDDQGTYTCTASNRQGEFPSSSTVTVPGERKLRIITLDGPALTQVVGLNPVL